MTKLNLVLAAVLVASSISSPTVARARVMSPTVPVIRPILATSSAEPMSSLYSDQ